jgi:GNAT superfamily N-acetyltransferase
MLMNITPPSKSTSLLVRPVEESELPQLLTLLQAKAVFDSAELSFIASVASLREALFGPNQLAHALVAVENGALIGVATYYATFSSFVAKPCLWLDDLFVQETHRSKGVGRALVKRLCEIAQANGCGRVDWVVAASNTNGRAFYTSLGAAIFESVRLARLDAAAISMLASEGS